MIDVSAWFVLSLPLSVGLGSNIESRSDSRFVVVSDSVLASLECSRADIESMIGFIIAPNGLHGEKQQKIIFLAYWIQMLAV